MQLNSPPFRKNVLFFSLLPWLILCLGLAITYVTQGVAQQHEREVLLKEFNFRFNEIVDDIEKRLASYKSVLRGAAGLFDASQAVGRDEFRRYVSTLKLESLYPGIQGVGYSLLIAPEERERHLAEIRREGFADYAIQPEGGREAYTSIIYLEPFDWRNQRAFGYDMFSEPTRRTAMERARDEDRSVASGKVMLLQEEGSGDQQAGFLMYVPVYREGSLHKTLAQRQHNLQGWVYAPFRMHDLMRGILGESHLGEVSARFHLEIFDGSTPSASGQMYDSNQALGLAAASSPPLFRSARAITISGRDWTIRVSSLPLFESQVKGGRAQFILIAGGIISLLLAWIVWLLINGRSRAVQLAEKMNGGLIESERQLRESEHYQQLLLANLPAAVVVHGPDGAVSYCNAVALQILGLTEAQVLGRLTEDHAWRFLREDGSVMPEAELPEVRVLAERQPLKNYVVGVMLGEQEAVRWALLNAFPDYDDSGALRGVIVSFVDITERILAEAQLRNARADMERILNVNPAATYQLRLGSNSIFFRSKAIIEMMGYGMEAWQQPGFWLSHIHPEDKQQVLLAQNHLSHTGMLQHEYRFRHRDGHWVWVLDRVKLVRNERGEPAELIGAWLNITPRKQAEIALEKRNRFYRMLSLVNEAIVRIRGEQQLFEEICRITVEEGGFVMAWVGMLNDDADEVLPVACRGHDDGYLAFLKEKGVLRHNGQTARAIQEGRYYINQDTASNPAMAPWRDEALRRSYRSSAAFPLTRGGQAVGALTLYAREAESFSDEISGLFHKLVENVSFALDFLDQEQRREHAEEGLRSLNNELEARIEERTRMLESANKELEAFSYSVSHDLRAPLRSIDGFSEILQQRYAERLDESGRDYLGRVRRASKRMGELIDDLLLLARVTRADLHKQPVNLSQLVQGLAREMQEGAPQRQLEWVIQDGIEVQADSRLIKVVLENLLGNAWKFTVLQTAPRIEFGSFMRADEKVIFVRDNGAGFDMHYAGKLFGAFQRLHRADEFEGTGIGLATVQRVIHRHGGRVWAEGQTGAGATFYFTL